jgi:hypothetical protein
VLGAKLRLYNVNKSDMGGEFYSVADNTWVEDSVTWNTAPMDDLTLLASLGPVEQENWYEVDITSLITGDGTYSFRINTTSTNGADYASKEAGAGLAPQLIVSVGEQ